MRMRSAGTRGTALRAALLAVITAGGMSVAAVTTPMTSRLAAASASTAPAGFGAAVPSTPDAAIAGCNGPAFATTLHAWPGAAPANQGRKFTNSLILENHQ